jgi:hypothetical protein
VTNLRPLSIGEIFDRAVTLVVHRWPAAVPLTLLTAVLPTVKSVLTAADPRFARHAPFANFMLTVLNGLVSVFAVAALYHVFAAEDDRPDPITLLRLAFGDGWRLVRVALLNGFIAGVCGAIFAGLTFIASRAAGWPGAIVVGLPALAFGAPLYFVLQIAFANAVLEGTGAVVSLLSAKDRATGAAVGRTWRLAFAALVVLFLPELLVRQGIERFLAPIPGFHWTPALTGVVSALTGSLFFAAVIVVSAIDLRSRREGADLEAALDEPAFA